MYRLSLPQPAVVSPWRGLDRTRCLSYRSNQSISLATDTVAIVHSGALWIESVQGNGSLTLVALLCPGMAFPCQRSDVYQACTLGTTEIERSSLNAAFPWRERSEPLVRTLLQMDALLEIRLTASSFDAVSHFLALLAQLFVPDAQADVRLPIRLTHGRLAVATGCTRTTITRHLITLRAESLIHFDGERHLVISRQLIERFRRR